MGCIGDLNDDDTTQSADTLRNEDLADDSAGDPTPTEVAVAWAQQASNFDDASDIVDVTGTDTVSVENGPGGNPVFEPAVVRIDAGTTVTWAWKSDGHNVEAQSGYGATITEWDSYRDVADAGFEHQTTFEAPGVALYFCSPHLRKGQHGAVVVE